MNILLRGICVFLACSLSLTACQKNNGGGDAFVEPTDADRELDQPRLVFKPTKQPIKNSDIDRDNWDKLLDCDKASTHERLDKEVYSLTHTIVERSQGITPEPSKGFLANAPKAVKSVTFGYSTDDSGINYEKSEALNVLTLGAQDFLQGKPYSFIDSCTGNSCTTESRKYTSGDPMYGVTVLTRFEKALVRSVLLETDSLFCDFETDGSEADAEEVVEEGVVTIGKQKFKAVRKTRTKDGIIFCIPGIEGRGKKTEIGKAVRSEVQIVLADYLPRVSTMEVDSKLGQQCSRSGVFEAKTFKLKSSKSILFGSSKELGFYKIKGEITPLDDWEDKQDDIATQLKRLEEAVDDARLHEARKKAAEADELAKKRRLGTEVDRLNRVATETAVRRDLPKSSSETTEDYNQRVATELRRRMDEHIVAERAYEAAIVSYDAAAKATIRAKRLVEEAEEAFRRFRLKHGKGS